MNLSGISLLVDDQEKAKAFFVDKLGFCVKEDISETDHRWLLIAASELDSVGVILTLASSEQKALVGKQAVEGVLMVLQTQHFDEKYQQMIENGIEFCETPRTEPYGKVAIFKDVCGNQWDLIQRF